MRTNSTAIRRLTVTLLGGLGIVLAGIAGVLVLSTPDPSAGDVEAVERSQSDGDPVELPSVSSSLPAEPAETPQVTAASTILPNAVNTLDGFNQGPRPKPVGLVIEAIDVDAPVIPQGINARTGQMEVPHNVSDVAWYQFGPAPGEKGSAVLAAHVDLAAQGPGVFFELRSLQPGDLVEVTYDDATNQTFRVAARTIYEKDDLPVDAIFSREGPAVLTLITCGGSFNSSVGSYDSNVVVYAVPVTPAALPPQFS